MRTKTYRFGRSAPGRSAAWRFAQFARHQGFTADGPSERPPYTVGVTAREGAFPDIDAAFAKVDPNAEFCDDLS